MAKIKLHELLAIEGNLETQASATRKDLTNTFEKKRHLFEEKQVRFDSDDENVEPVVEHQSDIQSTVLKELKWIRGHMVKAINAGYQIDMANTMAKADIITEDGQTLAKDVPATALLALEKRLAEFQSLLHAIPTLDPAKGFGPDPQKGDDIFKARTVIKPRTRKKNIPLVLQPPTQFHPAQVQMVTEDVPVGKVYEQEWSSLITPAVKADYIAKGDALLRAVKQARSRANSMEVADTSLNVADALFNYILG